MKYFLDSAKLDEILYAVEKWGIQGVTTNPKHILASGKTFIGVIRELGETFTNKDFPISVEINPHIHRTEDMVTEAIKFSKMFKNFVIKIPATEEGIIAAKILTEENIAVNLTLVFSVTQALQAARIGVKYCSPFLGWQEASGIDTTQFLRDIAIIYENYGFKTEIIAAAIRNGKQIADAAVLGIDIVTAGFDVYQASFKHPFTDRGLHIFQEAWNQTNIGKI